MLFNLRLDDSNMVESQKVSAGVVLAFNNKNQVVSIEMLNLSHRPPHLI